MNHLTDELLQALARGEPRAVSHFREHLARACPECEELLRRADGALGLDAAADCFLLPVDAAANSSLLTTGATASAPLLPPGATADSPLPAGATEDPRGWAAVRAQLPGHRQRKLRRALGGGVAAMSMLLVGFVTVMLSRENVAEDGIKGPPTPVLELKLAHQRADGTTVRIEPSASLPPSGILVIRYHASEAGKARVFRQRQHETSPTLLGEVKLEAGTHDLPSGISLDGESGDTTYWLEATTDHGGTVRSDVMIRIGPERDDQQ